MRFAALLLTAAVVATPALADDLVFTLNNNSSVNLQELYVSPVGEESWGEDVLGVEILAAGDSGTVTLGGGTDICNYDLKFVTDTGNEVAVTDDLCVLPNGEFNLND